MGLFDIFKTQAEKDAAEFYQRVENTLGRSRKWSDSVRDHLLNRLDREPFNPRTLNEINLGISQYQNQIQLIDRVLIRIEKHMKEYGQSGKQSGYSLDKLNKAFNESLAEKQRLSRAHAALSDSEKMMNFLLPSVDVQNDKGKIRHFHPQLAHAAKLQQQMENQPYAQSDKGEKLLNIIDNIFKHQDKDNKKFVNDLLDHIKGDLKKFNKLESKIIAEQHKIEKSKSPYHSSSTYLHLKVEQAELLEFIGRNIKKADTAINSGIDIKNRPDFNKTLTKHKSSYELLQPDAIPAPEPPVYKSHGYSANPQVPAAIAGVALAREQLRAYDLGNYPSPEHALANVIKGIPYPSHMLGASPRQLYSFEQANHPQASQHIPGIYLQLKLSAAPPPNNQPYASFNVRDNVPRF